MRMENIYEYIARLQSEGKWQESFDVIRAGLKDNYNDYELYFALGEYYLKDNIDKAYLCYENALFYCDNKDDRAYISGVMSEISSCGIKVKPLSIVIVSYNSKDVMKACIKSIRINNISSSYEIVVVDNASTDGVTEWLESQNDITLIKNQDNKGFGAACNQGIKASSPDYDIFLLNNDTVVSPNAIFWMRMGLYENDRIGATSCMSNNGGFQNITEVFDSVSEYIYYATKNNIPEYYPYENKVWLAGFAVIIKRDVLDQIGLLDLRYGKGYYEDDDIGIRIQKAGYQCIVCHNSFIFHCGSFSFNNDVEEKNRLSRNNRKVFKEKWGFDIDYYSKSRNEIIQFIKDDEDKPIHVLEIGCGCGATLAKIKYLWPHAEVKGIELIGAVADIGANNLDIIQGNIEEMDALPYRDDYFDYVIFADVLEHLREPQKVLEKIRRYMKNDAALIVSVPNFMNITVMLPLLRGNLEYADEGILGKTHLKMFTMKSCVEMLTQAGYSAEYRGVVSGKALGIDVSDEEKNQFINALQCISGSADIEQFDAYQYIFKARVMK